MPYFAVIDLGSNSARMSVTKHEGTHYETVTQVKDPVRLSENMGPEKELKEPAVKRTLKTLKKFTEILASLPDVTVRAVATAATRQATNQKAFLKQVRKETGLELEVISGIQEAHYDYLGVISTLPVTHGLLIDTGGASTEIVYIANRKDIEKISIPFGSVNLTERFIPGLPLNAADFFDMSTKINSLFQRLPWLTQAHQLPVIALGGSNRTLAKINRRAAQVAHFEDIHGYRMSIDQVNQLYTDLLTQTTPQLKSVPGLSKDRADIVIGGLMPMVKLMQFVDSPRVTFSQSGLREGILFEHLHRSADLEHMAQAPDSRFHTL